MRIGDLLLEKSSKLLAYLLLLIFVGIIVSLVISSHLTWQHFGWHFLIGTQWNPIAKQFSALTAIIDTLVTAALALVIAVPLSFAVATFANRISGKRLGALISFALKVMAGIPSIIFGMWGLFILAPFLASHVQPALQATLGHLPLLGDFFSGPAMGIGVLTAGLVLAVMIIPLLTAMMIDLLAGVPANLTEAAYACGATRWEVVKRVETPYLRAGIIGSIILGLGRALGETMAVTFVIGNTHLLSRSLFMPGNTIASTIANEYTEATGPLYSSSLMALALILMVTTFFTIMLARWLLQRYQQ